MENTIQSAFKIEITKNYKLRCFYIDSENKEIPIQLKENQEEYIPCIIFNCIIS